MHISFLAHPYFFHYYPGNVTILFDLPGGWGYAEEHNPSAEAGTKTEEGGFCCSTK
jgi:hypothetical protein